MNKTKKEIRKYIKKKKDLQLELLNFLDNATDDEESFDMLKKIIQEQEIQSDRKEFEHFLYLLLNISNNHYRVQGFFDKIERILLYFKKDIEQSFSNYEIFKIFFRNKRILLFLFKTEIITITKSIVRDFIDEDKCSTLGYCHFFFPEIRNFLEEEKIARIINDIKNIEKEGFENIERYENLRLQGENSSYLSSLIRNDSIDEFIDFFNQNNFHLSAKIKPSLFETNSFLIGKSPSLIEYAVFFGSINILRFLFEKEVELESSLWIYAVHSNNAELIHFITENCKEDNGKIYEKCYKESLKCHHNVIALYFKDHLLNRYILDQSNFSDKCFPFILKYQNYSFIPQFNIKFNSFYYLSKYDYSEIVDLFISSKRNETNKIKIFINFF